MPWIVDIRQLVGRNVMRLRKARGWTQQELEVRSKFSQHYLSGLERGLRNPTVVTVCELASALEVDYLELLGPEPQETGSPAP